MHDDLLAVRGNCDSCAPSPAALLHTFEFGVLHPAEESPRLRALARTNPLRQLVFNIVLIEHDHRAWWDGEGPKPTRFHDDHVQLARPDDCIEGLEVRSMEVGALPMSVL